MPKGLLFDIAKGTARPMINTNEGKIKSAGDKPFQFTCLMNQGASGPLQSTIIMPIIVSPLKISKELSLCF